MTNKYDTAWPRFAAGLWDGLILLPLTIITVLIQHHIPSPVLIVWYFLYFYSRPVYTIWMHGKYGQTIGKRYSGVIVLNVNEGRIMNYKEAILRELPQLIMILFYLIFQIYFLFAADNNISQSLIILYTILSYTNLFWFLTEIITMLGNDKRRALHDYLANSVVIRKEEFIAGNSLNENGREEWN
ncbi:MAG TPA: RDD family protein [Panacibacter sp.]|nr:RDD family protein [Panacibacter sp.]